MTSIQQTRQTIMNELIKYSITLSLVHDDKLCETLTVAG